MSGARRREAFAVPPLAHGGLFGAFLGCHAIADALQLLHTGVGCKGKTQRHLVDHDLGREAHAKVGWTELTEAEWIRAPLDRLEEAAVELHRRRRAGGLVLTSSAAVDYTGADLETASKALESRLGLPVLALPGVASAPDLYAGYGAVVRAVIARVDWSRPPEAGPTLCVAGHFFHRYEQEQAANLAGLRRLVDGLGGSLGPVLLSGDPLGSLLGAHRARAVVGLPYAGLDQAELARRTGRAARVVGLPMGLAGTAAWLRVVGELLGAPPERIERMIAREERRAAPRLDLARRVLAGRTLAILADAPLAAGWVILAAELGLSVSLVGLLDRSLGGEAALRTWVEQAGKAFPGSATVLQAPSLLALREAVGPAEALGEALPFDLVVRPDLGLAGTAWERIPTLEMGFPATHKHFVFPAAELGYSGAVALAGRLMDALGRVH